MLHQRVARLLPEAVDEVEDALREPGLLEDAGPQRRRQRRELGGLQHDGVAGRERGTELPRLEHERRVPRRDEAGDADRLAVHVVDLAAGHLVGVVGLGDDQVGEEPEVLGGATRLSERLRDRQARVERLQLRQLRVTRLDEVGDPVEHARALARQHPRPGSFVECALRRGDGGIDVGLLAGGRLHVGLIRDGIEHVERLAADRVDELAVDVVTDAVGQALGDVVGHVLPRSLVIRRRRAKARRPARRRGACARTGRRGPRRASRCGACGRRARSRGRRPPTR